MSEQSKTALPLQGLRVLVTRTRDQASALSERLRALGALPLELPTIQIVPPSDWSRLDAALTRLYSSSEAATPAGYDWLIFTSANGVRIGLDRLRALGYDPSRLQDEYKLQVAAIGPATAEALRGYGLHADLVPLEYIAEGIVSALLEYTRERGGSLAGQRILLARAAEARKVLPESLREAGADVDEVAAYSTVTVARDDAQGQAILALLHEHHLAVLTFTSSSTVRNFVTWLKGSGWSEAVSSLDLVTHQPRPLIACIGPITSQTARELGLPVDIEANTFTIDGLVEAIVQHMRNRE